MSWHRAALKSARCGREGHLSTCAAGVSGGGRRASPMPCFDGPYDGQRVLALGDFDIPADARLARRARAVASPGCRGAVHRRLAFPAPVSSRGHLRARGQSAPLCVHQYHHAVDGEKLGPVLNADALILVVGLICGSTLRAGPVAILAEVRGAATRNDAVPFQAPVIHSIPFSPVHCSIWESPPPPFHPFPLPFHSIDPAGPTPPAQHGAFRRHAVVAARVPWSGCFPVPQYCSRQATTIQTM